MPEGEARQADEIVRHYRSLVAHPAVQSINYWGLTDRNSWLGAPVGFYGDYAVDGTPFRISPEQKSTTVIVNAG